MTNDAYLAAEARARVEIDRQLVTCGWAVQSRVEMNLYAAQGVAVREFIMAPGHGRADYLLFVDGKAVGGSTRLSVGDGLVLVRHAESSTTRHSEEAGAADSSRSCGSRGRRA